MRLIDADDFGNRMYHEAFEKDSDLQKLDSGCWIRYKLFENVLREQPTVEERKKGYWYTIERGEHGYSAGSFRCSVCGEPNRSYNPKPNFCGNCGADMRKERKG